MSNQLLKLTDISLEDLENMRNERLKLIEILDQKEHAKMIRFWKLEIIDIEYILHERKFTGVNKELPIYFKVKEALKKYTREHGGKYRYKVHLRRSAYLGKNYV